MERRLALSALELLLLSSCREEDESCCWSEVAISVSRVCGIRDSGFVECWGTGIQANNQAEFVTEEPTERIRHIVPAPWAPFPGFLALDLDDRLQCWGTFDFERFICPSNLDAWGDGAIQGPDWPPIRFHAMTGEAPTGAYRAAVINDATVCLLGGEDGFPFCWNAQHQVPAATGEPCEDTGLAYHCEAVVPIAEALTGPLMAFHDGVCGWREDGSVLCWGVSGLFRPESETQALVLPFDGVRDVDRLTSCPGWRGFELGVVLDADGRPWVNSGQGSRLYEGIWYWVDLSRWLYGITLRHEDGYTQLAASDDRFCLLHENGDIECIEYPEGCREPDYRIHEGDWTQVFAGHSFVCALDADGRLDCFGADAGTGRTKIPRD